MNKNYYLLSISILLAIIGRIMPHPVAITPMLAFSLFLSNSFSQRLTLPMIVLVNVGLEMLLSWLAGWPLLGSWSFFTTTGYLLVALGARNKGVICKLNYFNWQLGTFLATMMFWIWTNLGVWLFSGIYTLDYLGINACYVAALPFLVKAVFGDIVWATVFYLALIKQKWVGISFYKVLYQAQVWGKYFNQACNQSDSTFPKQGAVLT